jgi:hypothetical protein
VAVETLIALAANTGKFVPSDRIADAVPVLVPAAASVPRAVIVPNGGYARPSLLPYIVAIPEKILVPVPRATTVACIEKGHLNIRYGELVELFVTEVMS